VRWSREAHDRGAAAIEFAIVLGLLLLLGLGIVEYAFAIYTKIGVQEAAEDGILYLAQNPTDTTGARDRIKEASTRVTLLDTEIVITCPTPSSVRLEIDHDHDLITGILAPIVGNDINLQTGLTTEVFSSDPCTPDP